MDHIKPSLHLSQCMYAVFFLFKTKVNTLHCSKSLQDNEEKKTGLLVVMFQSQLTWD